MFIETNLTKETLPGSSGAAAREAEITSPLGL